MRKHELLDHGGQKAEWGMRAKRHYLNDPLGRQNNEGVCLENRRKTMPASILNSKSEHHQPRIPRLIVSTE